MNYNYSDHRHSRNLCSPFVKPRPPWLWLILESSAVFYVTFNMHAHHTVLYTIKQCLIFPEWQARILPLNHQCCWLDRNLLISRLFKANCYTFLFCLYYTCMPKKEGEGEEEEEEEEGNVSLDLKLKNEFSQFSTKDKLVTLLQFSVWPCRSPSFHRASKTAHLFPIKCFSFPTSAVVSPVSSVGRASDF